MAISEENVRIQSIIPKDTSEKINELSKVLNLSQSKTIAFLLEGAIDDSGWVIRLINNKYVHSVLTALGVPDGKYSKRVIPLPEPDEMVESTEQQHEKAAA